MKDTSLHRSHSSEAGKRKLEICRSLRAKMPSFDDIMTTVVQNGAWWDSFRQKTVAISQTETMEPLTTYATRAYTSSNPAEVGLLALAYARSANTNHSLYETVDHLIISDFAYATTTEGMECLVLLAKSYTDLAQPRRAWFTWRKGLAIAQLMVS